MRPVLLCLLVLLAGPASAAPPASGAAAAGAVMLRLAIAPRWEILPDGWEGLEPWQRRPPPSWYQEAAQPGGLVRVACPGTCDGMAVRLIDGRGKVVCRGTGFRSGGRWVALVGVPSVAAPGAWRLAIGVTVAGRTWWTRAPLRVSERSFKSESIALTRDLTALRTVPDARKNQEALVLARVLASADPEGIWHQAPFSLPLGAARRTSGYGDRRTYRYDDGSTDLAVHAGLDLAMAEGTPVTACGRGKAVFAGVRIVSGGTVVIEHLPGLFSLYFHLHEVLVRTGQVLEVGDILGTVGMTGLATGPHLHWEVQLGGVALDPDLLVALPALPVASSPP